MKPKHMQRDNAQASGKRFLARRIVCLACLVAGLTQPAVFVEAQQPLELTQPLTTATQAFLHVELTDRKVTVKSRDVITRDLVAEIARQYGLVIISHAPLDKPVTLEFHRLSLHQAMSRILRDQSFALRYIPRLSSAGNAIDNRVSLLWIFSDETETVPANSAINVLPKELLKQNTGRSGDTPQELATLNENEAIASLRLALANDDPGLRLDAVLALADLGSEQATVALAAALSDGDSSVREEVVDALGDIGSKATIPLLERALLDPENKVREAAIAACVDIGGNDAVRALSIALNDTHPSLRKAAVEALGEIGGKTAIHLLQQALTDQENHIRETASELLVELASQEQ